MFTNDDMEFTKAEKQRINQLYGNDFADIQPEDAKLIGRWEVYNATMQNQIKDMQTEIKIQSDEQLRESKNALDTAMSNLERIKDLAVIKLKAVEDEQ